LSISLGIALSDGDSTADTVEDQTLAMISDQSEFPAGSFKVDRNLLKPGNPDAAPKNVTADDLQSWGVTVSTECLRI
jgi:hypothetical protein